MRYVRLIAVLALLSSLGYTVLRWRAQVNWRPTQVVLLTVASLPVARLGDDQGAASITPNLDALARQSVVFDRTAAGEGGSVRTTAVTLASLFQQRGTATAAVDARSDPDRGFATVIAQPFAAPPQGDTASLMTWLAEHARLPFFLWIHDDGPPPGASDGVVAWSDALVGRVLRQLAALGLGDGVLVVFTASRGDPTHPGLVPLLIGAPRFTPRRVYTPVEQIDVLPTVVALADLPPPAGMPGKSLLPLLDAGN
ncbi:MAG: hypothetical protein SF182_02690 [Deltaproteobacteria bacterium]|nr:hypothetical protein [Deltaproteobacteria bacterium]